MDSPFFIKPKAMKKLYTFIPTFLLVNISAQQQTVSNTINPNPFEDDFYYITINGNSVDEAAWVTDHSLYLWTWSYDTMMQSV
jgi:hypothetical protein